MSLRGGTKIPKNPRRELCWQSWRAHFSYLRIDIKESVGRRPKAGGRKIFDPDFSYLPCDIKDFPAEAPDFSYLRCDILAFGIFWDFRTSPE